MASDAEWYADMIRQGKRKLEDVPEKARAAVQAKLKAARVAADLKTWKSRWVKSGYLGQMPKGEE